MIELIQQELNGKKIAYSSETEFIIQSGKGKGMYRNRRTIVGNLGQAVMHYNMLNVHSGYKKRLIAPSMNKPIIARHITK